MLSPAPLATPVSHPLPPLPAPPRPPRSARQKNDNFEEGLLKLVRTLPKVLKFLPSDKAQDARNFVQGLQYWLGGNSDNLQNFLLTLCQAYVPALKGTNFEVADPELFPEVGGRQGRAAGGVGWVGGSACTAMRERMKRRSGWASLWRELANKTASRNP
jgi:cobalamin biosynthesis Mg chelatase CobN